MKSTELRFFNTIGALGIVLIGVLIGFGLLLNRAQTESTQHERSAQLVTVMDVERRLASPRIEAQGTVVPARQVTLESEVSGRVLRRHPGLVNGGVVQQNEILLEIDPRDYQISVEQAENQVKLAEAELAIEEGHQVVAEQEWEHFGNHDEEPPPLALRKPQQEQAQLEIDRAKHELERARLNLERTRVRAPFAALVQEASIEPGELISPRSPAAKLVALDEFWVQVSVPFETLGRLAIPGRDGDQGSRALVRHESGQDSVEHEGEIIRLLGDLDPSGSMARILVGIEDPFSLSGEEGEQAEPDTPALRQAPLLLNSFVSVELEGRRSRDVIKIPRIALHGGNRVHVANSDDVLEIREVDIAWRNSETVAVERNLNHGERLILSGLSSPVEGMPLRVEREDDTDEVEDPS